MKRSNRLLDNPITRRVGAWLVMFVIGAIFRRLTGQSKQSSGRKYIKNRSK